MNDRSIGSILTVLVMLLALAVLNGCGGGGTDGTSPAETAKKPADTASKTAPAPPPSGDPAPTGSATIVGTVRYEGAVPKLPKLKMDADPGCAKKHATPPASEALVLGEGNTTANVFVQVKGGLPAGSYSAPSEPVVIDQDGCRYSPHVLGVMVGQPLKILNSDGLLHNVHALPKVNKTFNMAMPASRTEAEATFDKAEEMFKIKCDVHPWMGAYVAVTNHPYFAVTGTDGRFSIANLPAGTYEIEAWHEKLGTKTMSVEVADGARAAADITFTR